MVTINHEGKRPIWPEDPKFRLGRTVATSGAIAEVPMDAIYEAFARHERGDWGEMPPEDKKLNEEALEQGGRLVSKWNAQGTMFYLITEADRSLTTALLVEEY